MFERYTEKARRVIFFARYEASHYGSPYIETEHLLLGVLREDKRLLRMLPSGAAEYARGQIDAMASPRPSLPTSVDLPLSKASKRVLAHAADEAEFLNHRHIGSEHLLLGLLGEKGSVAAKLLEHFDVKLEQMRKEVAATKKEDSSHGGRVLPPSYQGRLARSTNLIKLRDGLWDADYVREAVRRCCEAEFHWRKTLWTPRDSVVERKTGKVSLDLSLAQDSQNFDLVKGGWKKDYCAVCRWELFESQDEHGTGYTNGRDWLCTECYDKFWDRPDFVVGSYSDII